MQVLLKSMDMKMWRGEEHEPWENVEARVIDAAEAVNCEEALFTDFKALAEEKIPTLILETSTRGLSLGQIQLRLEAFREMIAGDLP